MSNKGKNIQQSSTGSGNIQGDFNIDGRREDIYQQTGNYGIGHISDGEIKDNAKITGRIEGNNNNQVTVDINT